MSNFVGEHEPLKEWRGRSLLATLVLAAGSGLMNRRKPVPRGLAAILFEGELGIATEGTMTRRLITRNELLSELCDRNPDVVADTSLTDWDPELHRAARLLEEAGESGELTLYYSGAATSDNPYGTYKTARADAVQWALKNGGLFPRSRISSADVLVESSVPDMDMTSAVDSERLIADDLRELTDVSSGSESAASLASASDVLEGEPLTIKEAAAKLHVCDDTIRRMGKRGEIEILKIGPKLRRVRRSDIVRLLKTEKHKYRR